MSVTRMAVSCINGMTTKKRPVRNRLFVYYKQTAPLIGYYYAKGCWRKWMATEPIETVHAALRKLLKLLVQMFKRQGAKVLRRQPARRSSSAGSGAQEPARDSDHA